MKRFNIVMATALVVALTAACAPQAAPAPAAEVVVDAALTFSGVVDKGWTLEDLNALPMTSTDYTNKDGETKTYSGVSFTELFKAAGIEKYSSVTLIAADEYSVNIDQKTLDACSNCIIAIGDNGSLRSVMPDMQSALQVKDLVELQVK